jgi:predicted small lipoprotein YifL
MRKILAAFLVMGMLAALSACVQQGGPPKETPAPTPTVTVSPSPTVQPPSPEEKEILGEVATPPEGMSDLDAVESDLNSLEDLANELTAGTETEQTDVNEQVLG